MTNTNFALTRIESAYHGRYAVVTIILAIICAVLYIGYAQRQVVISGINFYPHPVKLTIGSKVFQLQPFDSFYFSERNLANVELKLFNESGSEQLQIQQYTIGNRKEIITTFLLPKDIIAPCWISAEVSAAYYNKVGTNPAPRDIKVLSEVPLTALRYMANLPFNQYIVPSQYAGDSLPQFIGFQRQMYGIYAVNCAEIGDQAKIATAIGGWQGYTAEKQRELFAAATATFPSLPMYNDPGPQ